MDAKLLSQRKKLEELLAQAAAVAAEIQAEEQGTGIPHYSQIEMAAHSLGQQLSRQIQETRSREIAAESAECERCPSCGDVVPLEHQTREVLSTDGRVQVVEPVGHCDRCRRSFFPSSSSPRI